MMLQETADSKGPVLVSDFDGTMTRHDFYTLVVVRLIPHDCPDYWQDYRRGTLTHFAALQHYFAAITATEAEVQATLDDMQLDPGLPNSLRALHEAGWKVVITSAGCDWYIRRLLAQANIQLEVHANPGVWEPGRGLQMRSPVESPFWSAELGINKAGVVQHYLAQGRVVAFAGDGFPDVEPARLVSSDLRFARADLAGVLSSEGASFCPFEVWSDVAQSLLNRSV